MKAMIFTKYGLDSLQLEDIQKPTPGDNEILVEVYASSLTVHNLGLVRGKPFLTRLMGGALLKPKRKIPGSDMAGRVKAVGRNVKQFQPGDEVYGDLTPCGFGAFAEYVCVPEQVVAPKPANLSFEEAAAVPQAALVALQGLRDKGHIQAGQNVLIHGASGGVGTFAVQLAKYFGARVTGVCSTRNIEMVRSLGADHVIDYTQEDFTKNGQHYDLIFATAYRSIFACKRALSPKGRYVSTGGPSMMWIFQDMLLLPLLSSSGGQKLVGGWVLVPNKELAFMRELLEEGKVKPVIDKCYPLREAALAFRYFGEGHARGKVVITVQQHDNTSP